MKEHRWTYWARDERGTRHRGVISYGEDAPSDAPAPPATFRIALLARRVKIDGSPEATAIWLPTQDRREAPPSELDDEQIAALKGGKLPPALRRTYMAGTVVLPMMRVKASGIFPKDEYEDELEKLIRRLIEMRQAELRAPYVGMIRHELGVPAGADALAALESRLSPADPRERPPARAPGIVRLKKMLAQLKSGEAPAISLDTLSADLRFLRLFERSDAGLRGDALTRLLDDVRGAPRDRAGKAPRHARPAPMRRKDA